MKDTSFNTSVIIRSSFLTAFFLPVGLDQGFRGKWIIKQKLEHTVIVLKSIFCASPALATVSHLQLFHCVVPWCFSACVSIHHVCAGCTKADPLQNRIQSVIQAELSLTTGWPWHYSDGDCLTNKHFRFTSAGSSQCCCYGYTYGIEDTLNWKKKKERWPTLLKAPTGPENTLWFHYKNHIMVVNTIKKLQFYSGNLQRM